MSQKVASGKNKGAPTRATSSSKESNSLVTTADKVHANKRVNNSSTRPSLLTELSTSDSEFDENEMPASNIRGTGLASGSVSSSNKRSSAAISNLLIAAEKVSRNSSLPSDDSQEIQPLDLDLNLQSKDDRIKQLELHLSLATSASIQSRTETPLSCVSSSNVSSVSSSNK